MEERLNHWERGHFVPMATPGTSCLGLFLWCGRAHPVIAGVVPVLSWLGDEFNIQKLTREGGREGGRSSLWNKNMNILKFSCFISCFMIFGFCLKVNIILLAPSRNSTCYSFHFCNPPSPPHSKNYCH